MIHDLLSILFVWGVIGNFDYEAFPKFPAIFTATFERKANIYPSTRKLLYFEVRQRIPQRLTRIKVSKRYVNVVCGYTLFVQTLFDCLPTAIVRKGRVCRASGKVREDLMRTEILWNTQ